MSDSTGQVLITCAPPNPNGDLHLGHLSGPFLGADVLRRYLRSRGRAADYVSYTDDESCYIPRRAAELGSNAREVAHRYTRRIEQTLSMADMLPDYYAHPHREPRHRQTVQAQFLRLHEAGLLRTRTLATPYCETCEKFLYEADLRGVCRFCRLPCDGTYCEDCGFPQDPEGTLDNRCVRCGETPATRPTTRLVLPLAEHTDAMRDYYADRKWPRRAGEFCAEMLEYGLPDVPITRIAEYGIPVPLPGWEGHILDTWFSGIYGYMAATEGLGVARGEPDLAQRVWGADDTTLVHFIGFDCSFSHAVLWPAMLLAVGAPTVPRYVISNEFYHLEGEKFSTSRGHAIWGSEFLREITADAVRFHLCSTNPELAPANFSRAEFDHSLRTVLAGHLDRNRSRPAGRRPGRRRAGGGLAGPGPPGRRPAARHGPGRAGAGDVLAALRRSGDCLDRHLGRRRSADLPLGRSGEPGRARGARRAARRGGRRRVTPDAHLVVPGP
jgi:methionyl-tRNA synthetase